MRIHEEWRKVVDAALERGYTEPWKTPYPSGEGTERRAYVYEFLRGDEILYIGKTVNPASRAKQHSETQPWFERSDRMRVKRFHTERDALEYEAHRISSALPPYNALIPRPGGTMPEAEDEREFTGGDLLQQLDKVNW